MNATDHRSVPLGERLARRARAAGDAPLLTHYRPEAGERTDLSVRTFANWVDKTAHLLDDLGIDEDSDVVLPVLAERPGHWMGLVWPFACWQRGVGVRVSAGADDLDADLAVTGPDVAGAVAGETLACSLHPWGRPLTAVPAGVTDYAATVLGMPDAHSSRPGQPGAPAWTDAGGVRTFADVAALPVGGARLLLRPVAPWSGVEALLAAVSGTGSLVLVDGEADEATLSRIAEAERVTAG